MKQQPRRRRNKRKDLVIGIGVAFLIVVIAGAYFLLKPKDSEEKASVDKEKASSIKISFVGDVLNHQDMLDSAKEKESGKYNFNNGFKFIKDKIKDADFAVANLETTLSGAEKKYSGYPRFNTPDSILDALKDTGFDMVSLANNHINDRGKDGIVRTVNTVKDSGLDYMGLRTSEKEKNYTVKDIKGIKVGFVNYVFETAKMNGQKSINSIPLDKSVEPLVNTFNPQKPEENYPEMKKVIDNMKADGAEFIIFSMHWGDEYHSTPNEGQKKMAQKIADLGANLIIGGHPHVLQPVDMISTADNRKVPVVYSLGNFISHQTYDTFKSDPTMKEKSLRTEESMIANIELKKNDSSNKIEISQLSYLPTWVNRNQSGNLSYFEVVPSAEAIKNPDKYDMKNADAITRLKNSYDEVIKSMKSMTSDSTIKHPDK